jgi:quinol monooxygenase YgiN
MLLLQAHLCLFYLGACWFEKGIFMELLVVTLAQVSPAREADALARMRIISDTVRNAPGLLNARFYCSKQPGISYCMLTTWESAEWWQKAQERHSPYGLVQDSPAGIFHTPPDQWLMQYLWGYSRPRAQPAVAAAHLALVRPEMAERVQQSWLESLRSQAVEPILAFALLARSVDEEQGKTEPGESASALINAPHSSIQQGAIFFNLLSWPDERYREDFYANEHYQSIRGLLSRTGMVHILALDPI